MKLFCWNLLILVCCIGIQVSSLYADTPRKELIQALLRQLDHPQRDVRVEAEETLLSLGFDSLSQLDEMQVDSPAARESIRRIRLELQTRQTDVLFQPSRVSINPDDTLRQIIPRWKERNQVGLVNGLPLRQPLGIKLENATFWDSILSVKQQVELNWNWNFGKDGTRLLLTQPTSSHAHAHAVDGVFLTSAYLEPQRGNFNNPRLRRIQRVHCKVTVEPRIHLFYANIEDVDFSLQAGETEIAPFSPNSKREVTSEDGHSMKFTVDFLNPESNTNTPLDLKGKLRTWCAGQTTPVSFQLNEISPITKKTSTSSITLQSVDTSSKRSTICTVIADLDLPKDVFTSHRLGLLHQAMLVESGGSTISPSEVGLISIDGAHTIRYTFLRSSLQSPKLVYFVPEYISEQTLQIDIPNVLTGAE